MTEATPALGPKVYVELQKLSAPGYNGKRGMILYPVSDGRWTVMLESGSQFNIKADNLKVIDVGHLAKARGDGSWKTPLTAPRTRAIDKYYGDDPDGYDAMRKNVAGAGDIQTASFDHKLYKAMTASLNELGCVTIDKWKSILWPEIVDSSGGSLQLTCNERWTLRFGLGELNWDFDARYSLLLELPTKLHVMSVTFPPKEARDVELMQLLRGPSLEALGERPSKKTRTEGGAAPQDKLIWVDGMYLDKEMLIAAREAVRDVEIIDALEAIKIFNVIADDGVFTRCERWTLRFILSAYVFTDAAFDFLKEACFKLTQNDDQLA